MNLNRVCRTEDFRNSAFQSVLSRYFMDQQWEKENWPIGWEDRKFWEIGLSLLAVEEYVPALRRDIAMGIGAGTEATSFLLTRLFKRVFATDLYGIGGWRQDAPGLMLARPERFSEGLDFNRNRLIVQCMDALDLRCEDNTVDFLYSSSSIEHFGGPERIMQAAREMGRVVRPGGIISIATEYRLTGSREYLDASTMLFTEKSLFELIVKPSGCVPVDMIDLDTRIDEVVIPFSEALEDLSQMGERLRGRWSKYPHIVIGVSDATWTSVMLVLRKPDLLRSSAMAMLD